MDKLSDSVIEDIENAAYIIAQQAVDFYNGWKSGEIYIPVKALQAMGRRYLYLRDADDLTHMEVFEFGRLYAFFCLVYPPGGEVPTTPGIAIDFCNLIVMRQNIPSPTG